MSIVRSLRVAAAGGAVVCTVLLPGQASAAQAPHCTASSGVAITNPYLPMRPGTTYTYDGTLGKAAEHEVVAILSGVKVINGIRSVQTVDSVWVRGQLIEKTTDWFSQDSTGNVWYMGEFATQLKNGRVTGHAGSWLAGTKGALAGIVMEAQPAVGDTYRQEFRPTIAEDMATVMTPHASVSTPFGTWINQALETREFSPLEPGAVEHKFYVLGIGNVKTVVVSGGPEVMSLTGIQYSAH